MTEALVRCDGAARTYGEGAAATVALQPADCEVPPGATIAVVGPSGSGKSTLLHLLAGLEEPTVGSVTWPGIGERAQLRPGPVAMIFQSPSLLPPLTVLENVAFPLILDGLPRLQAELRARTALERLGLAGLADNLPDEVSGGQAQRVAAARALAGQPRLLLADEPTGQLDRASGAEVVGALLATARRSGSALVVATHDAFVADQLSLRWEMHDGRLAATPKEPAWSR
jgi:putative ABC transport system ATP-binding protein/lipoprotein-releasing system ATP-binding protein